MRLNTLAKDTLVAIACVIIAFLPSAAGANMDVKTKPWYDSLKPGFTPPSIVFPIAWSILYASIGVSMFAAYRLGLLPGSRLVVALYASNLLLNGLWTPLFFGLGPKAFGLSLLAIVLMIVTAAGLVAVFAQKAAARGGMWRTVGIATLVPYVAWLTFAAVLNGAFWRRARLAKGSEFSR